MATSRPNILLLMSDQHNARCTGYAGHPDAQTPHLDQLAAQGIAFNRAFAQNPICTPSRVCYLSGQYPHNHGFYGLLGQEPEHLPSLFSQFRAAGYYTGAIGKIHTPYGWIEAPADVVLDAYGDEAGAGKNDFDDYLRRIDPRLLADRDDTYLQEWTATGRGGQGLDARPSRLPFAHCVDHWCATEAIRVLEERPKQQPFLLWVSFPRPHETYLPSTEFWELYDEAQLTLPPSADEPLTGKPPNQRRTREAQRAPNSPMWLFEPRTYEAGRRRVLRGYLGCVSQVDACAGLLLEYLASAQLTEETLVVYCADHGDFAGEHGIIEKAPGLSYDAITRVPMLWSWPGRFAAGQRRDDLIETIDVFPTLCELAELRVPQSVDGRSLAPLLRGETVAPREAVYTENAWSKAIRTQRWKYVHYPPDVFPEEARPVGELYDLERDPWEMDNLFYREEHRAVVEELRVRLLDWLVTSSRVASYMLGDGARPHVLGEDRRVAPALLRAVRAPRNYL